MGDMAKFGSTKWCTKCHASRTYDNGGTAFIITHVPSTFTIREEHMDVKCNKCGYLHLERCADGKEA